MVDVACDNEEEEDDDDEDDESSEEAEPVFTAPPFKFDYGFNAMTFLGKYLHKHHPRNIARRLAERKANFQYLCKRAVSKDMAIMGLRGFDIGDKFASWG